MIYGELKVRRDDVQKIIEVLTDNGYSVNIVPAKKHKVKLIINTTKDE